jgi:hypothetical protein
METTMIHKITRRLLIAIFLACTGPAMANQFGHSWSCELVAGKTVEDVRAVSLAWLNAAKSMKGGDQLELYINLPIVVEESANRFDFVLLAPSLEAWGAFYDGYSESSPVGKADVDFAGVAACSGSTLWESIRIE